MSFQVTMRQHPAGQEPILINVELSSHDLQLNLTKRMDDITRINGQPVTTGQKLALSILGRHREISQITKEGEVLIVHARFDGFPRVWAIDPDGGGDFADGLGWPNRTSPTWKPM